jgi:hypothetical protein
MTEPSVTLAAVVGEARGEVRSLREDVHNLDVRMAVLERVAITPGRLTLILTVALSVAGTIFGAIAALAVVIHR